MLLFDESLLFNFVTYVSPVNLILEVLSKTSSIFLAVLSSFIVQV